MSLFTGSEPRMPKVRQPFDDDNFANAMIAICVVVVTIVVAFITFTLIKPDPLTPAEAKEKTEQKKLEIEHKQELLKICTKLESDKRFECIRRVESGNWKYDI